MFGSGRDRDGPRVVHPWAAGAVIPEQMVIPANSLVAGVPGKVRRTLGDEDRALILKYATNYLDYTAIYLREAVGS